MRYSGGRLHICMLVTNDLCGWVAMQGVWRVSCDYMMVVLCDGAHGLTGNKALLMHRRGVPPCREAYLILELRGGLANRLRA
jgi:hypothetical protein